MVDEPRGGDSSTEPRQEAFATTERGETAARSSTADLASLTSLSLAPAGYELGDMIGHGGMGEVFAAHDQRIGREVALKRMRSATPTGEALARFLREVRIQARLDHPAIVPVHELGTDEEGRPFFIMKRLTGRTLAHRLADGGSLNRILRAFVEVCMAIEFAHARGVVHRDLKPSNIMLGEYGEVYVLDWGIARVLDQPRSLASDRHDAQADIDTLDEHTKTGVLLGTPGYMSPEQIRALSPGRPADVYALGAILFEILAGEPLHPRGTSAIGSTLSRPQQSPLERRGGDRVPPELDAICRAALAEDPDERPTAHELAEHVQDYLDGDRDFERRRQLAAQQLAAAREALASDHHDARETAMRQAGRALALDPQSIEAAELVSSLVLQPPEVIPPALAQTLDASEREQTKLRGRVALRAYVTLLALFPALLFLDVQNWTLVAVFYGSVVLAMLATARSAWSGTPRVVPLLVANLLLAVMFTRFNGPFILTPLAICGILVSLTAVPALHGRIWLVAGWTVLAVLLPFGLEWVGALPRSWWLQDGITISQSTIVVARDHAVPETVALISASVVFPLIVGLIALGIHRTRYRAERTLLVQAWHLRQLIPAQEAQAAAAGARLGERWRRRRGHEAD